jgi:hypothetical protein
MREGMNSSMINLIYYKNFYKCHNEPQELQYKKEKENLSHINVGRREIKNKCSQKFLHFSTTEKEVHM